MVRFAPVPVLLVCLCAAQAHAGGSDDLLREVLRIKSAVEVGTNKDEMSDLAKSLIVEAAMAKRSRAMSFDAEKAVVDLSDAVTGAVRFWDMCPEALWNTRFPDCKKLSDEFSATIRSAPVGYQDPRTPWKPFSAYLMPLISDRADVALSAIK